MKVTVAITRIDVLVREIGTDIVYLHTTLPSTIVDCDPHVIAKCELRKGTAIEWVKEQFGREPDHVFGDVERNPPRP